MLRKSTLAMAVGFMLSSASAFSSEEMVSYAITVTNTTHGQVLAPPLVVAHNGVYEIYKLGMPASEALATMAENGNPGPLMGDAMANPNVYAAIVGQPIPPGMSKTVTISVPKNDVHFSVAGMLASTNDAFFAVNNIDKRSEAWAMAYDAGSEKNNELCSYVPGPPCNSGANNLGQPGIDNDAEGFVHIHNGIHGNGSIGADGSMTLNASMLDWRGPVAKVSVRRIH